MGRGNEKDKPQRAGQSDGSAPVQVRRVLKAYEQVAEQLREAIATGELKPGHRLPTEVALAKEFGVGRTTIREALRALAAQNLIRTAKGAGGGSYVSLPTIDHISEFIGASINLLTESRNVSLEEFLEARELLEVPAARLAAARRTGEDIEELRATIPGRPLELDTKAQFRYNERFHSVLVEASGNSLLVIGAQPIFTVLQTNLARSSLGGQFHRMVNHDHLRIAEAVADGNSDAAAEEMKRHLAELRHYYQRAWRHRHTIED
jgi:DNA-binding FadR family transcriptional regulator